ncbi:peptidase [Pseudoalteromonas sp. NBT06-2]|uniref:PepSY-associated TM helix domain-containing protein n=1 Tax=Pseudoalteromonas sp. NBT06-2 TaxID=2025950 RepID=UPI000BA53C8D|nr:PepSY-associated TM helix domain-containing protein [Pseudoalteromonas sp. NBT06-2]PAJ74065.1 peptidase [Pseudoalteromonas sp. NBT06-2]
MKFQNKKRVNKKSLSIARTIHIYVSMALLLFMLFFAFTGITLNHPKWFDSDINKNDFIELPIPEYLLPTQPSNTNWQQASGHWLKSQWGVEFNQIEFGEDEVIVVHKGPGTYKNITLDLLDNIAIVDNQNYGVIAVLNDLHKGRNSGLAWRLILDISSVLIILFSLTGAYLLLPQTRKLKKSVFYMLLVSSGCVLVYITLVP